MRPLLPLLPAGQQSIHGATHYPCVSRCWAPGSLVDERYPMFHQRKYPLITIPYPHQCRWFSPEVKSVLIETVWDSLRMFKGKLRGLANWPQSLGWFWWHCSDIFWLFFSLEKNIETHFFNVKLHILLQAFLMHAPQRCSIQGGAVISCNFEP